MLFSRDRPSNKIVFLYRCLSICLFVLVIILIAGTVYGLFFYNSASKNGRNGVLRESEDGQIFTGIGRMRLSTADTQPCTVILLVLFVYDPDDKAFSEELALRIGDFRSIIGSYISSLSVSELREMGDEVVKAELLRRFNNILRLGKIETLYFSDFMIIG